MIVAVSAMRTGRFLREDASVSSSYRMFQTNTDDLVKRSFQLILQSKFKHNNARPFREQLAGLLEYGFCAVSCVFSNQVYASAEGRLRDFALGDSLDLMRNLKFEPR